MKELVILPREIITAIVSEIVCLMVLLAWLIRRTFKKRISELQVHYADEGYLTVGSKWLHHKSKNIYTVLYVCNTAHESTKYPITIVYEGPNGNVWAKSKERFLATMCIVKPILGAD